MQISKQTGPSFHPFPGKAAILGRTLAIATVLVFAASATVCWSGQTDQTKQIPVRSSDPWQAGQLITSAKLAKSLSSSKGAKPLVFCVGFSILYHDGHIAGAKYAGPASRSAGIQALKRAVKGLPRDKEIVLYCGCCPWKKCPNIRAAFRAMQKWGFKKVKALYLPTDFRQDWIDKGFPTEKSAVQ